MAKQQLNIIIPANAEYGEVVDSIGDAVEAGIIIEETLEDGFQFQDLLAALQVQPKVNEIINDVPVFLEQFVQLNADTAKAAVVEARNRILAQGKPMGKVTNFIIKFLYVAANNYGFALQTYQNGQTQYLLWQSLINGGEVFPDTGQV